MIDENKNSGDFRVDLIGYHVVSAIDEEVAKRKMKRILEVLGNKFHLELGSVTELTVKESREYADKIEWE